MKSNRFGRRGSAFTRLAQAASLLVFLFSGISIAVAAVDVSGSKDIDELNRYPNSWIVEYSQTLVPEYRLALGKMKKVNAVVAPEKVEFVSGELTRITYQIPSGHSSIEAFSWFSRQLESKSYDRLFGCDGRRCGSSNQWANSQFGIARLYGADREQHYLALRLKPDLIVAIYGVRRGNKRVYVHLDIVRRKTSAGMLSADDVGSRLRKGERVVLADRDWNSVELDAIASAIRSLLAERPSSDIWLVGHQSKSGPFVRLQNDARIYAEGLKSKLVESGISENRLQTFGVGPLAPAYDEKIPENRIELLVE